MSVNIVNFIFGAVACSATVGAILWRIIVMKVNSELNVLRHDLEKKDIQISNLQEVQSLGHNGLKENFTHFSSRMKLEVLEVSKQVRHIDQFLVKTTTYETRD